MILVNIWKKLILAKNFQNLDFDQNFLVKIFGKTKFWITFSENLDFGKPKIEILLPVIVVEKFKLGPKFSKIPIFVSIFGNYLDFSIKNENFEAG